MIRHLKEIKVKLINHIQETSEIECTLYIFGKGKMWKYSRTLEYIRCNFNYRISFRVIF